jgi:hypothetical protein
MFAAFRADGFSRGVCLGSETMRFGTMAVRSRPVVAALALGVAGTFRCSSLKPSDDSVGGPGGEVVVEVRVTPTTIRPGEAATITVRVTNASAAARILEFPNSCQTSYEFLDGADKVVGSAMEMCAQVLTSRTLAPGESFADDHSWGRRPIDVPQLAPGTYRVRGILLAKGGTVRSGTATVVLP